MNRLVLNEDYQSSLLDRKMILAKIYDFILQWPDPPETEAAGSENLGGEAEPAADGAHAQERDAC